MSDLISVAEADARIAAIQDVAPPIRCPLAKAAGRVLREDILADRPLPPFDRVMMDGYALRYQSITDGVREFRVVGQCLAGEVAGQLPSGADVALEIMTGAPLPEGADVIIPYEETEKTAPGIRLREGADIEPGQCIHRLGSDYAPQSKLVPAGSLMGPVEMGVAASCGYAELLVSPNPRIAVVGTGDELVPISETPAPHQIRTSNATAIESALGLARFHVGEMAHWPDDPQAGGGAMQSLLDHCDVVVIAGAVSKGQRDWIPGALDERAEKIFHGVRQRPGKPMGLWRTSSGCTVFALPGNPVSAIVGLHRYVLPYLRKRDGQPAQPPLQVTLAEDIQFVPLLTCFLPVRLEVGRAIPQRINNSGDYARLVGTQGFVELSADASEWTAGHQAPCFLWSI